MNVYRKNSKTPLPGFVVRAHLRQKMFSAFLPRGRSLTTLTCRLLLFFDHLHTRKFTFSTINIKGDSDLKARLDTCEDPA